MLSSHPEWRVGQGCGKGVPEHRSQKGLEVWAAVATGRRVDAHSTPMPADSTGPCVLRILY